LAEATYRRMGTSFDYTRPLKTLSGLGSHGLLIAKSTGPPYTGTLRDSTALSRLLAAILSASLLACWFVLQFGMDGSGLTITHSPLWRRTLKFQSVENSCSLTARPALRFATKPEPRR